MEAPAAHKLQALIVVQQLSPGGRVLQAATPRLWQVDPFGCFFLTFRHGTHQRATRGPAPHGAQVACVCSCPLTGSARPRLQPVQALQPMLQPPCVRKITDAGPDFMLSPSAWYQEVCRSARAHMSVSVSLATGAEGLSQPTHSSHLAAVSLPVSLVLGCTTPSRALPCCPTECWLF